MSSFGLPVIYAITSGNATPDNFEDSAKEIVGQIREAVDENVSMFQIREKRLSARHLFELASMCSEVTRGSSTKLLINDRVDIALAVEADGVHLTSTSIPAAAVRRTFGDELIIGVSVHSPDEAQAASREGADFVVFGPVFETPHKGPAAGVGRLKRVCVALAPFPVIALGGIGPTNCRAAIDAGAVGVAGIRAFAGRNAIRSLRESLKYGQSE